MKKTLIALFVALVAVTACTSQEAVQEEKPEVQSGSEIYREIMGHDPY